MHDHTHTHIDTHTITHTHIDTHTHKHTHTHTQFVSLVHTHIFTLSLSPIYKLIHSYLSLLHINKHKHTHPHTFTHTYTHTTTHTHTHFFTLFLPYFNPSVCEGTTSTRFFYLFFMKKVSALWKFRIKVILSCNLILPSDKF